MIRFAALSLLCCFAAASVIPTLPSSLPSPSVNPYCVSWHVEPKCFSTFPMWRYDAETNTCVEYQGCYAGANKFQSRDDCYKVCVDPTKPVGTTTPVEYEDDVVTPTTVKPSSSSSATEKKQPAPTTSPRTEVDFEPESTTATPTTTTATTRPTTTTTDEIVPDECISSTTKEPNQTCDQPIPLWRYDIDKDTCVEFQGCPGGPNRFENPSTCVERCIIGIPAEKTTTTTTTTPKPTTPTEKEDVQMIDEASATTPTSMPREDVKEPIVDVIITMPREEVEEPTVDVIAAKPAPTLPRDEVQEPIVDVTTPTPKEEEVEEPIDEEASPTPSDDNNADDDEPTVDETTTTETPLDDVSRPVFCKLSIDYGECKTGGKIRYYYSRKADTCKRFTFYDGYCKGNRNNFQNAYDCRLACAAVPPILRKSYCSLPPDDGTSCITPETRYYYNVASGACQPFNFTGCSVGNLNNFLSEEDCTNECIYGKVATRPLEPTPLPRFLADDDEEADEVEEDKRSEEADDMFQAAIDALKVPSTIGRKLRDINNDSSDDDETSADNNDDKDERQESERSG